MRAAAAGSSAPAERGGFARERHELCQAAETFESELAQVGALIARRTGMPLNISEARSVEALFKDRTGARPKVAPRPKARGRSKPLSSAVPRMRTPPGVN